MSPSESQNKSITDPIASTHFPRLDNSVDVGEDLGFQERWWKFEHILWAFFGLVLVADALGVFGAGPLAKAKLKVPGSGMVVDYERVERTSTPSELRIHFQPDAVQNGKISLYANEVVVKGLGASRVIPQPEISAVQEGGIQYLFPSDANPNELDFQLKPSAPGVFWFYLQIAGHAPVKARVVVMP